MSEMDPFQAMTGTLIEQPALAESHLKRQVLYDPHPSSAFSPLPPAFHLSNKHRKDQALAGQRAELDHILQPGYRTIDGDATSGAGPSRHAGGLAAKKNIGLGIRPSASMGSFRAATAARGVFVDSSGKAHDTEFDPFAGVAEMSRRKSRRRSAFGSNRRKGSESGSSEAGSDLGEVYVRRNHEGMPGGERREEEEIKRRLEIERRRLDDVSGYAAARRRSMMSERSSTGRATPSVRSHDDHHVPLDRAASKAKSSPGYYMRSPLSPTFGGPTSTSSYATTRTLPTTVEMLDGPEEDPKKSTETTTIGPNKKITITGFDPSHPETPSMTHTASLKVPDTGRLSAGSRASTDYLRDRPRPAERPREESFPETPAQVKRREDRQRRTGMSRNPSLAVDTALSSGGKGRILPEIEIVEDDDPRIIFPTAGRSTRVQTTHDHVIRGPFSYALDALAAGPSGMRRGSADHSARSVPMGGGDNKAPSSIIEAGPGGYLPSRWASGDRELRQTEDERDKYRPMEWGGKKGELGGQPEEWK